VSNLTTQCTMFADYDYLSRVGATVGDEVVAGAHGQAE